MLNKLFENCLMKLHRITCLNLVLIIFASLCTMVTANNLERSLYWVEPSWPGQVNTLIKDGWDIWEFEGDRLLVYMSKEEIRWAESNDFILMEAKDENSSLKNSLKGSTEYLTFAEYVSEMERWVNEYPDIVSLQSLGKSHENRDVWMIKISDQVESDEDEPEVLLISLQHAREWLSGATLHGMIDRLLESYGTDDPATEYINKLELYVILVANPDGFVYTHTDQRLWRKNRRVNGDGTFGVDLNRNWDFRWTQASSNSSSNLYRGPSPNSEPENIALKNWVDSRGDNLIGFLNYHTYGQLIMHNWAYTTADPPNLDFSGPLVREMERRIEEVNGTDFLGGSWAQTLNYSAGGSTNDYFHATLGIPTITFELQPDTSGQGGFAPSASYIEPSIDENYEGLLAFFAWICDQVDPTIEFKAGIPEVEILSSSSVNIFWETSKPSTTKITYGKPGTVNNELMDNSLRTLNHSKTITGLEAGTLYSAYTTNEALGGQVVESELFSFRTTVPPSPPVLQSVVWNGTDTGTVRFEPSLSPSAAGYRIYTSSQGYSWTLLGEVLSPPPGSIDFNFPLLIGEGLKLVRAVAISGGPEPVESLPSDIYSVYAGSSDQFVLIVDAFDRWNSNSWSNGRNHDFVADHGSSLAAYPITHMSCANEAFPTVLNDPSYEFDAIIWLNGNESTVDETLSSAEQSLIESYIDDGGNYFISGSEIGWDLGRTSRPQADQDFYRGILGSVYLADDYRWRYVLADNLGGIFDGIEMQFGGDAWGTFDVLIPDQITNSSGQSLVNLTTSDNRGTALQYDRSNTGAGKVVYLSFPFEIITGEKARNEVMKRVLDWFALEPEPTSSGWMLR